MTFLLKMGNKGKGKNKTQLCNKIKTTKPYTSSWEAFFFRMFYDAYA